MIPKRQDSIPPRQALLVALRRALTFIWMSCEVADIPNRVDVFRYCGRHLPLSRTC
jgi:hypothetical protein